MFVEQMLPKARERLVTIADDVPLIQAAKLVQADADLVIVCETAGLLVGIITKTDIVREISHCHGANCRGFSKVVALSMLASPPGESWHRPEARTMAGRQPPPLL